MLEAIVFDFDGVLVDSEPLHFQAFVMVAKGLGFTFDYERYLREFIGFDDRDAFRVMLDIAPGSFDGDRGAKIAELGSQKRAAFEALVNAGGVAALPGALELADEAIDAGLPIAVASGATTADIDMMLGGLDRRELFEVIVSADDVMRSKPHPETYAQAVEKLGVAPGACLAIEDTIMGIRSARDAGMMTLGVATTGPAQTLHEAQRVVESLHGVTLPRLRDWYG